MIYSAKWIKLLKLVQENILYPGKFRIDFIVVGTQKAGTSALDKYLRDHSQIKMPRWKELHYFDNDKAFQNNSLSNIRGFYRIKNRLKMYRECTPSYIYWDGAMQRVKQHNPGVKIIALLRNPVERAFSHWTMERKRDWETRDFKTCIEEEINQIKRGDKVQHPVRSYVERGLYAEQIRRIFSIFPKEQVLFLKYEDFLCQQHSNLNKIFSFIGVSQFDQLTEIKKANVNHYKLEKSIEAKKILLDYFEPNILEVEELLNGNCSDWKI